MTILPANPPVRLGDRARAAIRLRHLSPRTEEVYVQWMRRYYEFHGRRDPAQLGPTHVTAFLNDLAVRRRVGASTQNQALAAIVFLYRRCWVDLPCWPASCARRVRLDCRRCSLVTRSVRCCPAWAEPPGSRRR